MPAWTFVTFGALGFFAGASLAYQAVMNTQLRIMYLSSPLRASLVSYVGGLVCCIVGLVATRQSLNVWNPALRTHWWLWTGGVYGVVYLTIVIWLLPRLGSAAVFGFVIAGQMIASVVFDHFGLFGIAARAADPAKLLGVAFLVAGVVLIRRQVVRTKARYRPGGRGAMHVCRQRSEPTLIRRTG